MNVRLADYAILAAALAVLDSCDVGIEWAI
jgi:hypothetical protein